MGTEPAVQHIAVPLYSAGARDASLEFEIGARAMSERDYEGAAQHLALVTDGPRSVQARFLRTLALGLMGKEAEAGECLNSLDLSALAKVDTHLARWLEHFLQDGQRRSSDAGSGHRLLPSIQR
jgi:hypothetical protein